MNKAAEPGGNKFRQQIAKAILLPFTAFNRTQKKQLSYH